MKLDLHGFTIHDAWKEYRKTTQEQYWKERKYIVVITGVGAMNMQFHHWVTNDPYATSYEKLNDGAWKVSIKKKPSKKYQEQNTTSNLEVLLNKYSK